MQILNRSRHAWLLAAILLAALFAVPSSRAAEEISLDGILLDPGAPVGGNPDGDVTIMAFFDYNCPYCKQSAGALDRVLAEDGHIRMIYKDWPILTEASVYGAKLALAAKYQGKYVAVHNALMRAKGTATPEAMLRIIRKSGVDMDRLGKDIKAHKGDIDDVLQRNEGQAEVLGLRGTPVYFIGAERYGSLDEAGFKDAVAKARAAHPPAEDAAAIKTSN